VFTWVTPVMVAVMLIYFWIQMRGYIAFAISDMYFRDALLSSAASLGYTVEETLSRLKIKETGQEMQVAIQGWIGTAQLKPTGRQSADTVAQIARGMNQYFKKSPGKMNYLMSYFYLIIGLTYYSTANIIGLTYYSTANSSIKCKYLRIIWIIYLKIPI